MLVCRERESGRMEASESLVAMSARVDPRWTGIIEVLVSGLDGAVRWESDSVVLRLADDTRGRRAGDVVARDGRSSDLDGLRLCLGRLGVPVVFDDSAMKLPDASLDEFLRKLVESGLMVDSGRSAA